MIREQASSVIFPTASVAHEMQIVGKTLCCLRQRMALPHRYPPGGGGGGGGAVGVGAAAEPPVAGGGVEAGDPGVPTGGGPGGGGTFPPCPEQPGQKPPPVEPLPGID